MRLGAQPPAEKYRPTATSLPTENLRHACEATAAPIVS
jgi:hypothetical protein